MNHYFKSSTQRGLIGTLDEVDEHLQVPDLGFELFYQLLFDPGWVDDLCDGSINSLPQLFRSQVSNVLVQVHVQLFNQLIDDHLKNVMRGGYRLHTYQLSHSRASSIDGLPANENCDIIHELLNIFERMRKVKMH